MSGESFRFIHASDFHLERPLGDLDVLPKHLRSALASAPRNAALSVFEAALAENIDFLVLSGDLLSPTAAGPHGMSLLLEGFERLNEKHKPVFWSAGVADDPAKWPDSIPLPANVHLFPKQNVELVPVQRAGRTIAAVVGRSSDGRSHLHVPGFKFDPVDSFTVGVGYGSAAAGTLDDVPLDYWALGGRHNREEIEGGARSGAIYCGSPQGRCLDEPGSHGYTMVDVDADQTTRIHEMPCDTFRYADEKIGSAQISEAGSLKNVFGHRIARLQHEAAGRHLIIRWTIEVPDAGMLPSIGQTRELLSELRRDFGSGNPSAWTTAIRVMPPSQFPQSWQEEDTILGDFLRVADVARGGGDHDRHGNLTPLTEEHPVSESTAALLADLPAGSRAEVFEQATLLGVDLLRGGKGMMN